MIVRRGEIYLDGSHVEALKDEPNLTSSWLNENGWVEGDRMVGKINGGTMIKKISFEMQRSTTQVRPL